MTVALSGHTVVNSTDCFTAPGTSEREIGMKPSLEKNELAVSVSR